MPLALLLAILWLTCLPGAAEARPPVDAFMLRRIDGPGEPALPKFRRADSRCGVLRDGSDGTRIYDTFGGAILSLDFGGHRRRILPLLATDKPGDGHLLKQKIRTACVVAARRDGDTWLLKLAARRDSPAISETLRIDAEGRVLNLAEGKGLFHVVGENSRGNRSVDRFVLLEDRLSRFTCLVGESDASCEYQFLNYAERLFSDEIRHQSVWPDARRRLHHLRLDRAIAAAIGDDRLVGTLHRLIVANESATISPFQIWDAVLADSGMSFGPHQWDIGINPDAQRIFRELTRLGRLPAPDRYFRSVRRFSTSDLHAFRLMVPKLDRLLQSRKGRALVIGEYLAWLRHDALGRARGALPLLDLARREDQAMLLFYIDVDNQYGAEDVKESIRRLIEVLRRSRADLATVRAVLDARMMQTPFARDYPDKAAARLERTWSVLSGL